MISKENNLENSQAINEANLITLSDIYVISPFRIVAKEMKRIKQPTGIEEEEFKRWKENNVGTVHKFQGKEAKAVFFILGADENSAGSITWATREPNLLNVAVTRAKKEFYLIGDKKAFAKFKNLDVVAECMSFNASPEWQIVQSGMVHTELVKPEPTVIDVSARREHNNSMNLESNVKQIVIGSVNYWVKSNYHRIYVKILSVPHTNKFFYDLDELAWSIDPDSEFTDYQIETAVLAFKHVNKMGDLDER